MDYEKLSLKLQLYSMTLLSVLVEPLLDETDNNVSKQIVEQMSAEVKEAVGAPEGDGQ